MDGTTDVRAPRVEHGRRALTLLLVQIAGLLTAIVALQYVRAHYVFDFSEAALGDFTAGVWGDAADGGRVHCADLDVAPCEAAWIAKGRPPAIFWVGNSQLHGVNRRRPGDKTAVMMTHDALRADGYYLVGYSLPNISMMEIASVVNSVGLDYRPKLVIAPVVLNGLRGGSVREEALPLLRRPGFAERIAGTPVAPFLAPLTRVETEVKDTASLSTADRAENAYEAALGAHWWLWGERDKLRTLSDFVSHQARHKLFDATAQTKRSLINSGYRAQMALLERLVIELRARGIDVLLYVPPYRQDIPGPYIAGEYAQFKRDLQGICARRGAHYADLDDLVEGKEWGLVKDRLFGGIDFDFMHFTARGHASLTRGMLAELRKLGY